MGEGLDSLIFITVAFANLSLVGLPAPPNAPPDISTAIITQWIIKVGYEVIATPLTYLVVGYLKRKEGMDVYDRHTNFNPVALTE